MVSSTGRNPCASRALGVGATGFEQRTAERSATSAVWTQIPWHRSSTVICGCLWPRVWAGGELFG